MLRFNDAIAAWFWGESKKSEFQESLIDCLHEEFETVMPSGRVSTKNDVPMFESLYGTNPDFQIEIEEPRLLVTYPGGMVVFTYVEDQRGARNSATENRRRSTALFEEGSGGGKLLLRRLRETAL